MAPKKKDAKKKGDDDGDDPAEIGAILEAECEGLRTMLILEQERKEKSHQVSKKVIDNETKIAL